MPLSPPTREQLAKAGSTAREAAEPIKPTAPDIALLVVWALVLLVAVGATSMRLATGEGWLAKVATTVFGGEMPFDLVEDRSRPIDFGEVAPGLGSSLLLILVPILAAGGLGVGKRGWTIAAWVCLFAALPLVFLDVTNIGGPSVKDVGAAFAIGGGWVVLVGGLGLAGAALVALGRGGWHAHRQRGTDAG
jgi:hypothetical protein